MTLKVYQASFCLISKFQITLLNKGTGRLLFFFFCLFFKPHNLPIFFGFPILIDSKVKEIVTFLLIHVQKLQKMKTNKQKPECIQVPFFFFFVLLADVWPRCLKVMWWAGEDGKSIWKAKSILCEKLVCRNVGPVLPGLLIFQASPEIQTFMLNLLIFKCWQINLKS